MSTPLHDVMNTSDHLLDISSEHESLTHHPSLISAYESELQFDESTFQHETEPYHSQVEDNADLNETSGENFHTQSDRGENVQAAVEDVRVFSSSPRPDAGEDILVESEEDEEGDNPYSSYQQFHRDLSNHDDPKSELLEFELLEQDNTDTATPEIDLGPALDRLLLTANDDVPSYDSLKEYLHRTSQPSNTSDGSASNTPADQIISDPFEMGLGAHKSRRDKWVDNSSSDVTSFSNYSKPKPGSSSPSRIPRVSTGDSPSRSRPLTPSRTSSRSRSMTPTGIPVLRSKSQTTPRERSPSAARRSPGNVPASGRRSVSADNSVPASTLRKSGIPSPVNDTSPATRRRNLSTSQIPRSRPLTPSSSLRSYDRQSSEEPRSDLSEVTSNSRPPSRLPTRSKSGSALFNQHASRASVEPRKLQNNSSRPSRLPSARPSVTSATELTSQDEQSPDLDLSSGDEARVNYSEPVMTNTFITQPHNSLNLRNPPSSDTQPFSTQADTHDQFTSNDERSATEAPHTPKLKTTKITKTTYDYEEVETTKTTTRILAQSSPLNSQSDKPDLIKGDKSKPASARSKSQGSRLRRVEQLMDRRALSEHRRDSPSQFGEAKALNDAIRMLEARETKENKSPAEKSSWSPSMPDDMGDNSRPSSTWTSLAEYNNAEDTQANNTIVRVDDRESDRSPIQKKKGEEMPRTSHTHLPGAVNHAHYALPTTSYLANRRARSKKDRLEDGVDSSSSEVPHKSPRRRKHEAAPAARRPVVNQSEDGPPEDETESEELVKQLQTDFDDLLSKYAMAEVTIDQLRLGAKLNLYADAPQPSQATVVQPGTARSATTLSLPQKGQVSLNSSLQSANLGYNFPGSSPRQAAEAGILTAANQKPLSDSQRSLKDNVIHLQDQVGSFIAGVSGEGRLLNLKPEIHHQLYEALEQSQDTLHHQLSEEKSQDPSFDEDNQLAGQLHQIRMSMDEHIDKLPQIPQQIPLQPRVPVSNRYNSDDEGRSQTPSSVATGHSGSTSTQRRRRSGDRRSKRDSRGSRKTMSQGSKNSYSERSSSPGEDIMTDDETVRPRSHRLPMHPSKTIHGAASASSNAGSDQPRVKSRTRIQGSSDSGFIGSEEGKSPNTPTDRHLSGLPTIQSQAENSGLDSPRALTPDLSESRTAEWALRHKVPIEDGGEPVLPEPSKKRTLSRSSRKSVRSERSGQSSIRSEALRSIQSEIEKLRDDFNSQQAMLSPERQPASIPKHSFGSPMKATYQLPAGYQQLSAPKPQASNKADVRNSDLDLSEVEGGRGYTPAPQPKKGPKSQEYYPSTDEDPRVPLPHSDSKSRRDQQQPFLDKEYLDQRPPPHQQQPPQRIRDSDCRPSESSRRHPDNRPIKSEYLEPETANRHPAARSRHSDTESNVNQGEEMAAREYSRRHRGEPREYHSSPADRRTGKEYSPARSPASPYDYERPSYRTEDYQGRDQPRERPTSGRSHRSYADEPDYRGQRSGYRGEMSPISERPYEEPAREYYRKYKSPLRRSRSFQDLRTEPRGYSQTMDELNTRDLNQTTLPVDSTVYTNQTKSPHIAPPNAYSTPYHQPPPMGQSQQLTQPINQSYQPTQPINQSYQPIQQTSQSYQPMQQSHPPHTGQSYVQPQTYAANHQPYQQTVPVQPPVYQPQTVAAVQVPQHQTAVVPTATLRPGVAAPTTTYHTCTSCAGRGVLTATHHCPLCGSQEMRLSNQLSTLRVTNQPAVATVTSQTAPLVVANQDAPVVIPVSNEKKAYLTQQTAGGYLTQGVDVIETVESRAPVAVPVIESSPLGVRYYVRDYGAIHSDAEPTRSRSSRRRKERSRDITTAVSMDDLETSLRDARRSAESLKRLSRGMREDLRDELTRSLHRKSLNSSWLL